MENALIFFVLGRELSVVHYWIVLLRYEEDFCANTSMGQQFEGSFNRRGNVQYAFLDVLSVYYGVF